MSAILAACLISASVAVSAPAKAEAARVPSHDHQVTQSSFDYIGQVGNIDSETVSKIAKKIYDSLRAGETSIEIMSVYPNMNYQIDKAAVGYIFSEVAQNWDAGLLVNKSGYLYSYSNTGSVITAVYLKPNYFVEAADYESTFNTYSEKLEEVIAMVDDGWEDWEKALYVHDYIAVHFDYNHGTSDAMYTAYGMLRDGMAVCDGYASLYSMALNRVGLKATKVTNSGHAWNMVNVENSWYYVDVSTDDRFHGDFPGLVYHDCFLRNYSGLHGLNKSVHSTTEKTLWGSTISASMLSETDVYERIFWCNYTSNFEPIVIDSDPGNVKWAKTDMSGDTIFIRLYDTNSIYEYDDSSYIEIDSTGSAKWVNLDNPYESWAGNFSVLACKDNVLFFNTGEKIYGQYGIKQAELFDLTTTDDYSQYRIYGLEIEDGKLKYYLSYSPDCTMTDGKPVKTTKTVTLGTVDDYITKVKEGDTSSGDPGVPGVPGVPSAPPGAPDGGYGKVYIGTVPDDRYDDCTYQYWKPLDPPAAESGWIFDDYYIEKMINVGTPEECYLCDNSTRLTDETILLGNTHVLPWSYHCSVVATSVDLSEMVNFNIVMNLFDSDNRESLTKYPNRDDAYIELKIEGKDETSILPFSKGTRKTVTYYDDNNRQVTFTGDVFTLEFPHSRLDETIIFTPYVNGHQGTSFKLSPGGYLRDLESNNEYGGIAAATEVLGAYSKINFDKTDSAKTELESRADQSEVLKNALNAVANMNGIVNNAGNYSANISGTLPDGMEYVGSTLMLTGETKVRHYFKSANGAPAAADFTLTGPNGGSVEFKYEVKVKDQTKNLYYVEISNIRAANLGERYVLTYRNGEDEYKINYSAICNACSVVNTENKYTVSEKNLMKALYCYYKACNPQAA